MTSRDRVFVVIAAYNEAPVIASVVADVRRTSYQVVLVDDGSIDETGEIAARASAFVVTHPVNLGQGAALQTGIDFALAQGADVIVTFDADGQHCAADIPKLIEALWATKADYALEPLSRRSDQPAAQTPADARGGDLFHRIDHPTCPHRRP